MSRAADPHTFPVALTHASPELVGTVGGGWWLFLERASVKTEESVAHASLVHNVTEVCATRQKSQLLFKLWGVFFPIHPTAGAGHTHDGGLPNPPGYF